MDYYLVFIRTYGEDNGHYKLVKAESVKDAESKIRGIVGEGHIIDVEITVE